MAEWFNSGVKPFLAEVPWLQAVPTGGKILAAAGGGGDQSS